MTMRAQARRVSAEWDKHYREYSGKWFKEIGAKFRAVDPETATPETFAAIVGNDGWCSPKMCDECSTSTWDIVEVGEEPHIDSATAWVCIACLRKAVELIEKDGAA